MKLASVLTAAFAEIRILECCMPILTALPIANGKEAGKKIYSGPHCSRLIRSRPFQTCVVLLAAKAEFLESSLYILFIYNTSLQIHVKLNITKQSTCFFVLFLNLFSGKMAAASSEGNGKLERI